SAITSSSNCPVGSIGDPKNWAIQEAATLITFPLLGEGEDTFLAPFPSESNCPKGPPSSRRQHVRGGNTQDHHGQGEGELAVLCDPGHDQGQVERARHTDVLRRSLESRLVASAQLNPRTHPRSPLCFFLLAYGGPLIYQ